MLSTRGTHTHHPHPSILKKVLVILLLTLFLLSLVQLWQKTFLVVPHVLPGQARPSSDYLSSGAFSVPTSVSMQLDGKQERFPYHWETACDTSRLNQPKFDGRFVDNTEEKLLRLIATATSTSQPDFIVVDVGANVGLFTSLACKVFPRAEVHAFEPGDTMRSWLRTRGTRACGKRLKIYREAVSNTDGVLVSLYGPRKQKKYTERNFKPHNTGASISSVVNMRRGSTSLLATTITTRLDTKLHSYPQIDLVKIDAEGFDPLVLRGLEGKLPESVKLLYWEYSTAWKLATNHTYAEIVHWLDGYGYFSFVIGVGDSLKISDHNCGADFLNNVAVVHNVLSVRRDSEYVHVARSFADKQYQQDPPAPGPTAKLGLG